jgi:translation initiation factor 2 alpha subunit (eIF-2alpha)
MLNQQKLQSDIKDLVTDLEEQLDKAQAKDDFAEKLSILIHDYVSQAQVNVPAGILVTVVPATGVGATTSIGIGSLS